MFLAEKRIEQNLRQKFAYNICPKRRMPVWLEAREHGTKEVRDIKMKFETWSRLLLSLEENFKAFSFYFE